MGRMRRSHVTLSVSVCSLQAGCSERASRRHTRRHASTAFTGASECSSKRCAVHSCHICHVCHTCHTCYTVTAERVRFTFASRSRQDVLLARVARARDGDGDG